MCFTLSPQRTELSALPIKHCEDRILIGPASGEKGSKGRNTNKASSAGPPTAEWPDWFNTTGFQKGLRFFMALEPASQRRENNLAKRQQLSEEGTT